MKKDYTIKREIVKAQESINALEADNNINKFKKKQEIKKLKSVIRICKWFLGTGSKKYL